MKKFLVSYYATAEVLNQMQNATPQEISEATKPWMAWKDANEKNILDFGSRLYGGEERSVNSDWSPQEKIKTGYSIMQAESVEDLKEILTTHPQLVWNPSCSVRIDEFLTM